MNSAELNTEIAKGLSEVLANHGIATRITIQDIVVTDKTVSDGILEEKVSSAIINAIWPSMRSAKVFHYTSFPGGESILKSRVLRLTNIERRYSESEIQSFCETHQLTGYLHSEEDGQPTYRRLIMPNTFYSSFTTTDLSPEDEEYFWQNFAGSDGFRLTFEIVAENHNFRKMYYEKVDGDPIKLLSDVTTLIRERFNREFCLAGISRLCAFYLPGSKYGREKEYRLLHRVWDDSGPQPIGHGPQSYIEMPFGTPTVGYTLKLTQVCGNEQPTFATGVPFAFRSMHGSA
jgi:hypothetical protein